MPDLIVYDPLVDGQTYRKTFSEVCRVIRYFIRFLKREIQVLSGEKRVTQYYSLGMRLVSDDDYYGTIKPADACADPVTPLQKYVHINEGQRLLIIYISSAKKMSKSFPGSVVLTQDSAGVRIHGVLPFFSGFFIRDAAAYLDIWSFHMHDEIFTGVFDEWYAAKGGNGLPCLGTAVAAA